MASTIGSILRAATRSDDEPLNVLTAPCHERFEVGLCKTGHAFYAVRTPHVKDWNKTYALCPSNYTLLNPSRGEQQIPADVDFDVVLSQNKFGQFQLLAPLARRLQLPLVSLEHTLPVPGWSKARLDAIKSMKGDVNVFISEFSTKEWGWSLDDPSVRVVHHGIDSEVFSPNEMLVDKKPHILSVVNDWINRDIFCGFKLWQQVTSGLPVFVVGATPGLSEAAKSVHELVMRYREAQVFLNTSLVSPIPTSLLEAMSVGVPVISTSTAMLPQVIKHGVNGLISNDPSELTAYCKQLLADEGLRKRLGEAARKTILEHFSMSRFVGQWDSILRQAANR